MNAFYWICLAVGAVAFVMFVRAMYRAPLGYEDQDGFHFGGESAPVPVADKAEYLRLQRLQALCAQQDRPDEIAA